MAELSCGPVVVDPGCGIACPPGELTTSAVCLNSRSSVLMPLGNDDIVAIHQLYVAYCLHADDGNGEAFSDLFTSNGCIGGSMGGIEGSENLVRFANGIPLRNPDVRHVVVNVHADGDGDAAQGRAYLIAYIGSGSKSELKSTGAYRDKLRRVDGSWKFEERYFTPDP
jgi:hypothetical protein